MTITSKLKSPKVMRQMTLTVSVFCHLPPLQTLTSFALNSLQVAPLLPFCRKQRKLSVNKTIYISSSSLSRSLCMYLSLDVTVSKETVVLSL